MSLSVNRTSFAGNTGNVRNVSNINSTNKTENNSKLLSQNAQDTLSFKGKELSDEEKKELILKARTKACGYAFWGGLFSSLYYGLRSDEKVAKKYDLDVEKDKKLIKQIKKEQLIWTLPSLIPGVGLVAGGAAYIYNKNCSADDIDLKN